jgi:hypothetical protein
MAQESAEVGTRAVSPDPVLQRRDQLRSITHRLRIVMRAIQDYPRHAERQCGLRSSHLRPTFGATRLFFEDAHA